MKVRIEDVKRLRQQNSQQFESAVERMVAVLIELDTTNSAAVASRPGWVWYRAQGDGGNPGQAINDAVEPLPGLPVILQRTPPTGTWEVVKVQRNELNAAIAFDKRHARQHEPGGNDPLYVYLRMLVPLRATSNGDLTLKINPYTYYQVGELIDFVGSPSYSISSAVPGAGLGRWVLVYLDKTTNTLATVNGGTGVQNRYLVSKPDIPADSIPVVYVWLINGQTIITETDLSDARLLTWGPGEDTTQFLLVDGSRNSTGQQDFTAGLRTDDLDSAGGSGIAVADNLDMASGKGITLQGASGGPQSGTARDVLAGIGHILDGGHPANQYPATRDSDDAEFNNSEQAENNTIGTHAGGDFWEWSPGAPNTDDINPPNALSCLYILKQTTDSATDRTLIANISTIGQDDGYSGELVVFSQAARYLKSGRSLSFKLVDTTSGYYARIVISDDATNGITVSGYYDNGSGDTLQFSDILGAIDVPLALTLYRLEAGGNALVAYFYTKIGPAKFAHYNTNRSIRTMVAKANFIPDQIQITFHNTASYTEAWSIDSYRRVI